MPLKIDSITAREDMTEEELAKSCPADIDKKIDALVDECRDRDIDIQVYVKAKGSSGIMTTGWNCKRTRLEIFMTAGARLGIPEEVLAITAMAAISGHEMEVRHAHSEEELMEQLQEIANEGNKGDDPQIH